jgi:catechol 2,3-dioxygenase-like lactoylglutathione lyase family enzyme
MLDHISIPVRDFPRAGRFYDAVLATIGLKRTKERSGAIGYGTEVGLPPEFWIIEQHDPSAARSGIGLHVSFRVRSRDEVHAFHAAALAQGGKDAEKHCPADPIFPSSASIIRATRRDRLRQPAFCLSAASLLRTR